MDEKQNITYVFLGGRTQRLKQNGPNDFFYFYNFLNKDKNILNLIESKEIEIGYRNFYLYFFDKVLRKLTKLSIYSHKFLSKANKKIINKTDTLILTNESVGFSLLPYLLFIKIFKNIKVSIFIMGSFDKVLKFGILSKLYLSIMLKVYENFIFLGKGELSYAKLNFPKFRNKFHYLPFTVDQTFWKKSNSCKTEDRNKKKKILFVGNDLNRDYSFLIDLASSLENLDFTIVSNQVYEVPKKLLNVEHFKSDWKNNRVSDEQIRELYEKSYISIIPLVETLQPSGQSVALQSMSMGLPVLITKTEGFWDFDCFKNNENIFFLENNSIELWTGVINKLIDDVKLRELIVTNSKKVLSTELSQENIFRNFLKIIQLDNDIKSL